MTMEKRLFTVEEASCYIGMSKNTLYSLISQGKIPVTRLDRRPRIERQWLDDWISGHGTTPHNPA